MPVLCIHVRVVSTVMHSFQRLRALAGEQKEHSTVEFKRTIPI